MPRTRLSLSRRKALAYALCLAIFAGALWAALRLSFPPDPMRRHMLLQSKQPPVSVDAHDGALSVTRDRETRKFRLHESGGEIVATEVKEEDDD